MPKQQTPATGKHTVSSLERLSRSSLRWQKDFSAATSRQMRRELFCSRVAHLMSEIPGSEPCSSRTSWIQLH